jgi:hypothetical protein
LAANNGEKVLRGRQTLRIDPRGRAVDDDFAIVKNRLQPGQARRNKTAQIPFGGTGKDIADAVTAQQLLAPPLLGRRVVILFDFAPFLREVDCFITVADYGTTAAGVGSIAARPIGGQYHRLGVAVGAQPGQRLHLGLGPKEGIGLDDNQGDEGAQQQVKVDQSGPHNREDGE